MSPRAQYSSSYSACAPIVRDSAMSRKTRVLFAIDMLGFGHHAALSIPASFLRSSSLISELREHSRRLAGLVPLLGCFPHLPSDDPSQSLIARQPKHVIHALVVAPTHQFVVAESGVSPQDDF